MTRISESNKNFKRRQSNQTIITIVVVSVVTLLVVLYKINRTLERIEHRNTKTIHRVEVKREKVMDKYMDDHAEGAAWEIKNEITDTKACEDAGSSFVCNLGCIAVELKEQMKTDLALGITRAS